MEKSSSYTYFAIKSNGKIDRGFVANEKGIFNPEDVTRVLEIQSDHRIPKTAHRMK